MWSSKCCENSRCRIKKRKDLGSGHDNGDQEKTVRWFQGLHHFHSWNNNAKPWISSQCLWDSMASMNITYDADKILRLNTSIRCSPRWCLWSPGQPRRIQGNAQSMVQNNIDLTTLIITITDHFKHIQSRGIHSKNWLLKRIYYDQNNIHLISAYLRYHHTSQYFDIPSPSQFANPVKWFIQFQISQNQTSSPDHSEMWNLLRSKAQRWDDQSSFHPSSEDRLERINT